MGERKFVQTVLVTWPRWPPCPYMVKTLNNLLRNQKADDLETWYAASGVRVLPSLFKWWPWPILRQGQIWSLMLLFGIFSKPIVIFDLKLATDNRSDKKFLLTSKLCPLGAVCLLAYIHVLNHEKKMYKIRLQKDFFRNLQQMGKVIRPFCWHQNFVPWGLSANAPGLYTCIKSWKKLYKIRLQRHCFLTCNK